MVRVTYVAPVEAVRQVPRLEQVVTAWEPGRVVPYGSSNQAEDAGQRTDSHAAPW